MRSLILRLPSRDMNANAIRASIRAGHSVELELKAKK
jgi:hypothetical protein